MMWTEVAVKDIRLGDRLRPVDPNAVAKLAESIQEIGLMNPIVVAPTCEYRDGREHSVPGLVAGLHRVEAFKSLGRDVIPCITIEYDDLDRQIAEIDENLMRAELGDAMRAKFMAKRKDLYLEKHPDTAWHVAGGKGRQGTATEKSSFAEDAAQKTGVTDRTVRQAVRRGEKIDNKILDDVAGTEMDKGVELDALASLDAKQQRKAVEMVKSGKVESLRAAKMKLNTGVDHKTVVDAAEDDLKHLQAAWNKSCAEARQAFREWIDEPVFDKSSAA